MRLKILREENNLSQFELADKLNMSQQAISAYENGKREPDIETIKKFAGFFGVSTDYLLEKSDVRNPEKIDENKLNIAFSSGFSGLNDTNKNIITATIEGLLAKQKEEKNKKESEANN